MKRSTTRVATVAVVVVLAACGSAGGDARQPSGADTGTPTAPTTSPSAPRTSPPPSHELPSPTATPGPAPTGAREMPGVAAAIADLAEHLGVDPAAIRVVSYEDVTWPDGALGCPRPGMSYTQALVPGSRLVLEADGREYAYHAGEGTELRRCDAPQQPVRR